MTARPEPARRLAVVAAKAPGRSLRPMAMPMDARLDTALMGGIHFCYARLNQVAETPARGERGANQPNRRNAPREAA